MKKEMSQLTELKENSFYLVTNDFSTQFSKDCYNSAPMTVPKGSIVKTDKKRNKMEVSDGRPSTYEIFPCRITGIKRNRTGKFPEGIYDGSFSSEGIYESKLVNLAEITEDQYEKYLAAWKECVGEGYINMKDQSGFPLNVEEF